MRKSVSILMCCLILTFCICSYATEDISEPILPYGESGWISIPVTDFIKQAEEEGYTRIEAPSDSFESFITYENSNMSISMIQANYDSETFIIDKLVMYCKASSDVRLLVENLSKEYGEGKFGLVSGVEGIAQYWAGDKYTYFIAYNGSFDDVVAGKLDYVFLAFDMVMPSKTTTPKPTELPTPEPKPTPQVRSNIVVTNATLTRNSAGTDEAYITLKNKLKVSVDRVDFYVKCYDAYGNLIKGYNYYDVSSCFYDEIIKPGESSDKDIYWGLYGFSGTKSIEVAIVSYHTITGETIEIPEDQLFWKKFK